MTVHEACLALAGNVPGYAVIDRIPEDTFSAKSGPLSGIPFAVKNNICIKDFRLTCGSKLLENYISPYTATAVKQLMDAGAIPVCTANLDEFGMGSTGEYSAFGIVENPAAPGFCTGGSSSGCAALVASGCVPLAMASDTGGSARLPAAHCGVLGLKPTYGAYSRFGLTAYASSLEQIGIISSDISLMRKAHRCLCTDKDPLDATHRGLPAHSASFHFANQKIAILTDGTDRLDSSVSAALLSAQETMKHLGASFCSCTFERGHLISPAYYVIACAEASANLARFTGLLTGSAHNDSEYTDWERLYSANRALLGKEVQKRIALGAYVLREGAYEKYYLRALQYRKMLTAWFERLFQDCALLLLPVSSTPAPGISEKHADSLFHYHEDQWTACANLAGLPAVSVPWGKDSLERPVAIQLIAPAEHDEDLLDAAEKLLEARKK